MTQASDFIDTVAPHPLRNAKRGISAAEARELLERGEYGILSICGPAGQPYGVPLSYCVLNGSVYFHCAVAGRKLENLRHNNRVSFCVVGATEVLPEKFATRYESVILSGRAVEVRDAEKQRALEGLVDKYSPDFRESGLKYIASDQHEALVFRIDIAELCGKARR